MFSYKKSQFSGMKFHTNKRINKLLVKYAFVKIILVKKILEVIPVRLVYNLFIRSENNATNFLIKTLS